MSNDDGVTFTEFLLARIAEDEAVARAATGDQWEWWNLEGIDQGWSGQGPDLQTVTNEFRPCPYPGCTWPEGDPNHRGTPGQPGHSHRATETVLTAWGHDAWGVSIDHQDAEHIARHDPARVLAECEAKRRIIGTPPYGHNGLHLCSDEMTDDHECVVLRALASVYADHPDFNPDWRL
jgi:hypothetical protein